jgi:surface antigen
MKNNYLIKLIFLIIGLGLSNLNANYLDDLNTHTCPSSRANYDELGADQWYFYPCQCTSYVAWKLNQNGINFDNSYEGVHWGNAENWDNAADNANISYDNTPRVGDIAVWDPWTGGAHAEGHVAYVESVNSDGSVNISEYNFGVPLGYSTRNNLRASHYIHIGTGGDTSWTTGAYSNNANMCQSLAITNTSSAVNIQGETEQGYDYITIYTESGVQASRFSGTINESVTGFSGSSVRVCLTSDSSVTRSGVTVSITNEVHPTPTPTVTPTPTPTPIGGTTWTTGAYSNNANMSETLSISGASSLTVTINGVTESGYDYITIYNSSGQEVERFSGSINETLTVSGSSIRAVLTSDSSVTRSGVTVSIY